MTGQTPIRVLCSDDQNLLLTMYRQSLASKGYEIVGECTTPDETVAAYKALKPQVLVIDIRYGTAKTGFDAMEEILKFDKKANIVCITQYGVTAYINKAFKLGVKSILTKECTVATLEMAVSAASRGQIYHSPEITEKVMTQLGKTDPDPTSLLEPRDLKIFIKIAEGKTNRQIVSETGFNIGFVVTHRARIKEILGIDDGFQFTDLAVRLGLLDGGYLTTPEQTAGE